MDNAPSFVLDFLNQFHLLKIQYFVNFHKNRSKQRNGPLVMTNLREEKLKKDACFQNLLLKKHPKGGGAEYVITRPSLSQVHFQCISVILILKLAFVNITTASICYCYSSFCFKQYIILIFKVLIHNSNVVESSISVYHVQNKCTYSLCYVSHTQK